MNTWLIFINYIFYRLIRVIFHFLQSKIIWNFNGVNYHLKQLTSNPNTIPRTCQLLKIVWRKKLIEGDRTSPNDFTWSHDKFVNPRDLFLADPRWTLYTTDKEFVYFVLMPNPLRFYNARRAPFIFMRQLPEAIKLARMHLRTFCYFANDYLPDPRGPVVYYSNAARSGSTLLARIMQVSEEKIFCLAEADAFTPLIVLHQRHMLNETLLLDLIKAIFKFYCKDQSSDQTYFMKMQCNAARIVPLIKKAMPQIKHMYTFRRDTRRILSSLEKILRGGVLGDILVFLWNIHPELASQAITFGSYEYEMCQRFGMKDCLDLSIICHVASFYYYYVNRHLFDLPLIYYEDVIKNKEKTLRPIFDLCQLSLDEFIGKVNDEFESDSQDGTIFNQNNMKTVQDTLIDEGRVRKINEMCDQLMIPRLEF